MIATFDELAKSDGIEYRELQAYGLSLRIGSLSSEQLSEWTEAQEEDKEYAKEAGLWLLVLSLVDNDNKRIAKRDHLKWLGLFRSKADGHNSKVIEQILTLNDLTTKA